MEAAFYRCLAVAAVGSDRAWRAPGATGDPFDRGRQLRRVSGVSELDGVVEDDPVGVVDDLRLVAELDRGVDIMQADQPAGDSGITPASRLRVCATTCWVPPMRVSRSLIARFSRPLRAPEAVRCARLALRSTVAASAIAASAIPASSPVILRTAAWA
jgi:hypothetical protein